MARSKINKLKQTMAKKAAAKLEKSLGASNCDDLMEAMDQQDAKEDAANSPQRCGRSKEEMSDDEEDTREEDANEEEYMKAVEAIINANIEDVTKHAYRLNLVRLVKFLYSKKIKKTKIESFSVLLHENLILDMDSVVAQKGSKKE